MHFPNYIWCWASFKMFICHLYTFFDEVKVFGPFFDWGFFLSLSFKNSLFILVNNPASDMSFAIFFSQTMVCLFILLTVSFSRKDNNHICFIKLLDGLKNKAGTQCLVLNGLLYLIKEIHWELIWDISRLWRHFVWPGKHQSDCAYHWKETKQNSFF